MNYQNAISESDIESTPVDASRLVLMATFWLGDDYFGIEARWVQEILLAQHMTPVPLAPEYVAGLINLRGHIIMAVDLKKILFTRPVPPAAEGANLVVRKDEVVSLLVDDVGDVLELNREALQPVPPTLQDIRGDYLSGVYPLKDRLLLILNLEKILTRKELQEA